MKITLSAAMRARDVSRPRPEQLTEAAGPEEPAAAEHARVAGRRGRRRSRGPAGGVAACR